MQTTCQFLKCCFSAVSSFLQQILQIIRLINEYLIICPSHQGGSVLPISSTMSVPDSSLHGQVSHYLSGSGASHIEARLLQLTPSRSATVHAGATSTRPERRSTSGVRAGRKRSRHCQSDTAVLATSPLAHPVQTVLHHAFCFLWQMPYILN